MELMPYYVKFDTRLAHIKGLIIKHRYQVQIKYNN